MANTKLTTEHIMTVVPDGTATPYMVHVVLNDRLAELELDRKVVPQMLYNYSRNGMIVKGDKRKGDEARYTRDEITEFVDRWINKNYKIETKVEVVEETECEGQLEAFEV